MKKNDIIRLEILSLTVEGNGVGRYEGMAVFVPMTAVGDVIDCRIVKLKSRYAYGKIESIIVSSHHRLASDCDSFLKCGGCSFRHITYEAELKAKYGFVKDSFSRIGGFDIIPEPIIGCKAIYNYRNKAQLPVSMMNGIAVYGFFSQRSHRVVPISDCHIQPKAFRDIADAVIRYVNLNHISIYDETAFTGLLRHICLRSGWNTGEIMVIIVATERTDAFNGLPELLLDEFPNIKSVVLNINPDRTNVIMGSKDIILYGDPYIEDIMCGMKVRISPHSFYQVNTPAAETVYAVAKEYASLTGTETILDIYCGIGTVGLSMADGANKLIGVEVVSQAVDNARENAERNGVKNAEFICGDAGEISDMLADRGQKPDIILVDPPRKGCDRKTLDAILRMSPSRLVYISCDHSTAARDAKYLCDCGYKLKKVRPCDMFPRTCHVECVVLMSKLYL